MIFNYLNTQRFNWNIVFSLFIAFLFTLIAARTNVPNYYTWSTTASDAGIYLSFIPRFWVAHPGGATIYTFLGFLWSNFFSLFNVSIYDSLLWMNTVIALLTAGAVYWWGLSKKLLPMLASLIAISVIVSAIAFSQFGIIESYPTHGLILLGFFISWDKKWTKRQILFGGLAIGSHHALAFIVIITYLIGLFLGRKQYKAGILSVGVGLAIYSTIIIRALLGLTFDAQIDNTLLSINHYFRALTPILQLHIFDIPARTIAFIPIIIMTLFISIWLIIPRVEKTKSKKIIPFDLKISEKLHFIIFIVYTLYVLFYISTQGYRYYTVLPIILIPILFVSLLHLQNNTSRTVLRIFSLFTLIVIAIVIQIQQTELRPNNDMELMRDKLYEIRQVAFATGEQQIIYTQYYNEVIGTYWNEVYNHEFLDIPLWGKYNINSVENLGLLNYNSEDKLRTVAMYSSNSPVIVIPSIYTLQNNRISLRYKNLINQNSNGTSFDITPCLPDNPNFLPFDTYYCVAEQGLKVLSTNTNLWYITVNPYDTLGQQYNIPTSHLYITKQDITSFINDTEVMLPGTTFIESSVGYYRRWTDVIWPKTITGRPYWAAFIRGDFEHPYWDSDNWNQYYTVMFIGGWGFVLGFIISWLRKMIKTRKFISINRVFD